MKTRASKTFRPSVRIAAMFDRRKIAPALCLALCMLGLGFSARAQGGTFVTFDAPGAGTGYGEGTYAMSMDTAGDITGFYYDTNFVAHGFVRAAGGTITTFDPPDSIYTLAHAINSAGVITGDWYDANSVDHGFLRNVDGTFTTFDVPETDFSFFSFAGGIDPAGDVTGTYYDTTFFTHGFLRTSNGTITTIDAPGAGRNYQGGGGTQAFGINPSGTIAGCYNDSNSVGHGFVQTKGGTLTEWDLPNSAVYYAGCWFDYGSASTIPLIGINPSGAITGAYFLPIAGNPFSGNYRGFLRAKDGSFTTFDAVPSPSSPCCTWTFGIAINPAGVIAGFYNDYSNINHGFVRASSGGITVLDAPGAGTGFNQGTWPFSINPAGQVAGQYEDANYVLHGFLWTPPAQ